MTSLIDVIVPAAGIGSRMKADRPKQYLKFGDSTVLEATISRVLRFPCLGKVILALNPDDKYFENTSVYHNDRVITVVGGAERSDSVLQGLYKSTTEYVMVHDAARPCVMLSDIQRLVTECRDSNGGILAVRIPDTVKRADSNGLISETVPRNGLFRALTPQFFDRKLLISAYEEAKNKQLALTDEASAMELQGRHPRIIDASPLNIKLTEPRDMKLGELYIDLLD